MTEADVKDILRLVDLYADAVEKSVSTGDASALYLAQETDRYYDIDLKLQELIKDNAPTSLTVNLKVEDIEPLKGLIDLLRQHQEQLPKEIVEYCVKNFGGDE